MYKISENICAYLLDSSRDMRVPGLVEDDLKPFVAQNDNAIGTVTPYIILGSNCKFILELDSEKFDDHNIPKGHAGFFLYRREELQIPDDYILVDRSEVDHNHKGTEKIDLTDCTIELPNSDEKAKATSISTVDKLHELLPDLNDCLDPDRERISRIENKIK